MEWNDGPGTVAAVAAVLALMGSFIAFVRSVGAGKQAARAEERAIAAETRANEARDRAADALEQIAEAHTPKTFVRWGDPEQVSGTSTNDRVYRVQNVGTAVARAASLQGVQGFVHPRDGAARDVQPQQSLTFSAMSAGTSGPPVVEIEWIGPDDEPDSFTAQV